MEQFLSIEGLDDFLDELKAELKQTEEDTIETLKFIGEQAVAEARRKGKNNDYTDRTGNLRSSIGYMIIKDGKAIAMSQPEIFDGTQPRKSVGKDGKPRKSKKPSRGTQGAQEMKQLLRQLQSEYPDGITLVLCAGMIYASYVEDIHHRDVLTSAKLLAEKLARQLANS